MPRVHAWLSIQPVNEELPGDPRDPYYGDRLLAGGIQRKYSGDSYESIQAQMADTLRLLGANPANLRVKRSTNTESDLVQDQCQLTAVSTDWTTGLRWAIFPCTEEGVNVDIEPAEPRGE